MNGKPKVDIIMTFIRHIARRHFLPLSFKFFLSIDRNTNFITFAELVHSSESYGYKDGREKKDSETREEEM